MLYSDLMHIGLSEKQAKVYVALLELGKSSVQDLAQRAKVNRATTYVILDELMELGLVSSYDEGKKTFMVAESPERLQALLEAKKREIEAKESDLKKLLPKLKQKHQTTDNGPVVRFFEGKEGLKMAVKEILGHSEVKDVQMFYNKDLIDQYFSDEERQEIRNVRMGRHIKSQSIYSTSRDPLPEKEKYSERIRVSGEEFPNYCDIALYKNKVRIASFASDKPVGIIIQDEAIYKSFLSLFELAWKGAKHEQKSKKA